MMKNSEEHRRAGIYTIFRSSKTTATIIAALLSLYLIGLLVPQKTLFRSVTEYEAWKTRYPLFSRGVELLQLNEIYVSPVTIFFLALFFLNLVTVLAYRVPLVFQRAYLGRRKEGAFDVELLKKRPGVWTITVTGRRDAAPEIRSFLQKRLWSFIGTRSPSALIAVKNRYSPFGFLLFHVSFLLCLVGGLFVMYTRFSGELVLTEGQQFNADLKQFHKITRDPKIFKALPPVGIQVNRVLPKYEKDPVTGKDIGTDLDIQLKIKYWDSVNDEVAKINEPIKRGPLVVLAHDIGVSPLLVLRAPGGKVIDGGFISLKVLKEQEDSFQFDGLPYTFFVRFYPDHVVKDGVDASRSQYLRNPVIRIRVQKGKEDVYEGALRIGQAASFDSDTLYFEDIRYWVNFKMIREYGNTPLFAGYLCGAIGLIMRLVFYQKSLRIVLEDRGQEQRIWIEGRSEYYQHSFEDDMTIMMADLRAALERTFGSAVMERGELP